MIGRFILKVLLAIRGILLWKKHNLWYLLYPITLVLLSFILGLRQLYILFISYFGLIFIVSEIFNFAIEKLCNLYTKNNDNLIKDIKDISAGATLLSAVALLLFWLYAMVMLR